MTEHNDTNDLNQPVDPQDSPNQDDDGLHRDRVELNADDFVDEPPNRAQCRQLLEEASGNIEKIESWNRLMYQFGSSKWGPDLSDKDDVWGTHNICLSMKNDDDKIIATDLSWAHLEGADLYEAHLEGADLYEAHLEGAKLNRAHLEGAKLSWAHLEGAKLYGAHIEGAELYGAHLEGAELYGAHLEGAKLHGAHIEGAELHEAHLEGAKLNRAHLEGADLRGAHLEGAELNSADFGSIPVHPVIKVMKTVIRVSMIPYEKLKTGPIAWMKKRPAMVWFIERFVNGEYAMNVLKNSHPTTILNDADLRGNEGFIPNGQSAKGARFDANAKDPYSIVRRKYTGPLMLFNLVFLAMFFTPYIIRAGAWTAVDRVQSTQLGQEYLEKGPEAFITDHLKQSPPVQKIEKWIDDAEQELGEHLPQRFSDYFVARQAAEILAQLDTESNGEQTITTDEQTADANATDTNASTTQEANTKPNERSVLAIVLGFAPGFWGTLAGVLSIIFVFYNIVRGIVTWWLSQVRDAEERSGHLPEIDQYWWCYCLHTYFLRYVYAVAFIAFFYHAALWMTSVVSVPVGVAG